jgi:oligopeptide transport system permease protein
MANTAIVEESVGAWKRLRRDRRFTAGLIVFAILATAAFCAPWIAGTPAGTVTAAQFSEPSGTHFFGTDINGRDVFARVLEGTRISILVGLAGAFISLLIGTSYGMIAGYFGGRIDSLMMRGVDTLYSIPRLIVVIIFINTFDEHIKGFLDRAELSQLASYSRTMVLVLALGCIEWLTMARIVRGQVLALKNLPFVTAARALGQGHGAILLKHVLPNILGIVLAYLTLTIPAVILDEAFLSFLGLGIQAPHASLGALLSDGAQAINPVRSYWWLLAFPAATVAVLLLSLNMAADALRDALDPRRSGGVLQD